MTPRSIAITSPEEYDAEGLFKIGIARKAVSNMCGLCGVLGSEGDWTDRPAPSVCGAPTTRRAQQLERVRAANFVLTQFGLTLADWQGTKYQLNSRTGRTEIVDNLMQVWQAAERVLGRACDPLDPWLVARMEQIRRTG